MDKFGEEFLSDLETFTASPTPLIKPMEAWTPRKGAPPERHLSLGLALGLPIEAISYQLQQNEFFDKISSTLQVHLSTAVLVAIRDAPLLETKEQVWMFGLRWFNKYYERLLDSSTLRSEFYRRDHGKFLDLLKKMLNPNPAHRISFRDALLAWYPLSDVLKREYPTEDDDDDESIGPASQTAAPAPVSPPAALAPAASQTSGGGKRRLVLAGFHDPSGRNRTRRNLYN
jgi:hypothetical protein